MNIKPIGKFLDQPILISKLKKQTPKILALSAGAFGIYDTMKAPEGERKQRALKNTVILSFVSGASLISAFGLKIGKKQILPGLVNVKDEAEILGINKKAVNEFLSKNKVSGKVKEALNKTKSGILSLKDTKTVLESDIKDKPGAKNLFDTLFSKRENLSAKEIFKETGRLSILGLMPVTAGVLGGIAAEKITGESTKESASNKIKEGVYQFLANIFMCNIGAAGALFGAESLQKAGKIGPMKPITKLGVIMGGIFVTGILGGSYVANFVAKHILDPVFKGKKAHENIERPANRHCERTPEILDMALHTDDIATAGVLSGFRWIEPMLPLMYTISGYRAGIGYRNNKED